MKTYLKRLTLVDRALGDDIRIKWLRKSPYELEQEIGKIGREGRMRHQAAGPSGRVVLRSHRRHNLDITQCKPRQRHVYAGRGIARGTECRHVGWYVASPDLKVGKAMPRRFAEIIAERNAENAG